MPCGSLNRYENIESDNIQREEKCLVFIVYVVCQLKVHNTKIKLSGLWEQRLVQTSHMFDCNDTSLRVQRSVAIKPTRQKENIQANLHKEKLRVCL